ncbi:glycosyltransferase [Massilia sp. PWRC2]|uniref:glycosyltransferase n=1 Tax=Massilia sp. PWRC2 TaxID=2804626 RepID=UPI003CF2292E
MAIGSAGDLFPMLKIALALRTRGHRISFLAPEQHRPYVEQAGLAFHGVAVDEAVLDDPRLWHARHGFGVVWRATRGVAAALLPFVEALPVSEPCVLLVHPLALAEADLCRAARPDIRIAAAFLAPSNLPTVYDPLVMGPLTVPRWVPRAARRWLWRQLGQRLLDPVVLPGLNRARRLRGMPPLRNALGYLFQVADLSLALFPAWFGATQPDWPQPLLHAEFPLYDPDPAAPFSAELVAFLAAGEAPVVVTPGTGNRQAAAVFRAALEALVQQGRRAIFLTPFASQLPADLPASVLWQPYVPLRKLLPHCAAAIHHGGIGTTAELLRAGLPQIVIPFAHDQFDNGARVSALGVGAVLPASRLSTARLQHLLERVLSSRSSGVHARAIAHRFELQADLDSVCTALTRLPL